MVNSENKTEKMSLDEAIKHAEWKASDLEVEARHIDGVPPVIRSELRRSAENWSQLEEWIKELKELRKERIELKKQNLILRFMLALYEEDDEPDWIPVEEELPEEHGRYLVCFKDSGILPCRVDICNYGVMVMGEDEDPHWYFAYTEFDVCMDDEVYAWMYLPEACEE